MGFCELIWYKYRLLSFEKLKTTLLCIYLEVLKDSVKNQSPHFRKFTTRFLCSKRSKFEIGLYIKILKWGD